MGRGGTLYRSRTLGTRPSRLRLVHVHGRNAAPERAHAVPVVAFVLHAHVAARRHARFGRPASHVCVCVFLFSWELPFLSRASFSLFRNMRERFFKNNVTRCAPDWPRCPVQWRRSSGTRERFARRPEKILRVPFFSFLCGSVFRGIGTCGRRHARARCQQRGTKDRSFVSRPIFLSVFFLFGGMALWCVFFLWASLSVSPKSRERDDTIKGPTKIFFKKK